MKNKINNFLAKAPIWQISIAVATCMYPLMYMFLYLIIKPSELHNVAWMSVVFSVLCAFMVGTQYFMMRESSKFWTAAKEFEKAIHAAHSRDELMKLSLDDFDQLCKKSQGNPHNHELDRLFTMLITKHKYISK